MASSTFVKNFPIVAKQMKIGDVRYVRYYGQSLKVERNGNGPFDFIVEVM